MSINIILRNNLDRPLTHEEVDNNFKSSNNLKGFEIPDDSQGNNGDHYIKYQTLEEEYLLPEHAIVDYLFGVFIFTKERPKRGFYINRNPIHNDITNSLYSALDSDIQTYSNQMFEYITIPMSDPKIIDYVAMAIVDLTYDDYNKFGIYSLIIKSEYSEQVKRMLLFDGINSDNAPLAGYFKEEYPNENGYTMLTFRFTLSSLFINGHMQLEKNSNKNYFGSILNISIPGVSNYNYYIKSDNKWKSIDVNLLMKTQQGIRKKYYLPKYHSSLGFSDYRATDEAKHKTHWIIHSSPSIILNDQEIYWRLKDKTIIVYDEDENVLMVYDIPSNASQPNDDDNVTYTVVKTDYNIVILYEDYKIIFDYELTLLSTEQEPIDYIYSNLQNTLDTVDYRILTYKTCIVWISKRTDDIILSTAELHTNLESPGEFGNGSIIYNDKLIIQLHDTDDDIFGYDGMVGVMTKPEVNNIKYLEIPQNLNSIYKFGVRIATKNIDGIEYLAIRTADEDLPHTLYKSEEPYYFLFNNKLLYHGCLVTTQQNSDVLKSRGDIHYNNLKVIEFLNNNNNGNSNLYTEQSIEVSDMFIDLYSEKFITGEFTKFESTMNNTMNMVRKSLAKYYISKYDMYSLKRGAILRDRYEFLSSVTGTEVFQRDDNNHRIFKYCSPIKASLNVFIDGLIIASSRYTMIMDGESGYNSIQITDIDRVGAEIIIITNRG